ncbi:MAG: sulfatase-like hydrolase/transferase [Candidatus Hydrogenedentes bacterium]|nr:sulfatase-like hydrolase/transferase [Candidatus Hydrogenedentota bacterium]
MYRSQPKHRESPRVGRRAFLASAAFAAAGLTAHGAGRLAESAARVEAIVQAAGDAPRRANGRPNILVITTDQQWGGAMGCAGNPYLRTPAMDSLAANGVQFEAAYTPNPICVPARTSYMTGTSSHENGVVTNMRPGQVDVTAPCLAKYFRDGGYDTGHVGKWHIPRPIEDTAWSGFNYINSARNNGVDFNIPEHCAEFMLRPRENPFLLIASFVNPHDICEWARRLSGLEQTLPNGEIGPPPPPGDCPPLPPNRAIPEGEPAAIRQHQFDPNMTSAYPTRDWAPDDPRWRQYLWGYYRMTELVDAYIGQVLGVLREAGLEENTAIVFASDHGDGLGAHRWNQKTLFYDEVARVPFIVSWKGRTRAGLRNREHLINLGTDLFPTLFDLAGIPAPEGLRGLSAAPAALGRADAPAHPYIVTENNHHSGVGNPTDVHGRMLRSARYKYIRYSQGAPAEQLFNLETDPGETTDLAHTGTAPDVLNHHRRLLDDHLAATGDPFPRFRAG